MRTRYVVASEGMNVVEAYGPYSAGDEAEVKAGIAKARHYYPTAQLWTVDGMSQVHAITQVNEYLRKDHQS